MSSHTSGPVGGYHQAPIPPQPPQTINGWGIYVAQSLQHLIDKSIWQQQALDDMRKTIKDQGDQLSLMKTKLTAAQASPQWRQHLRGQMWKITLALLVIAGSRLATGKWPDPNAILKLFTGLG